MNHDPQPIITGPVLAGVFTSTGVAVAHINPYLTAIASVIAIILGLLKIWQFFRRESAEREAVRKLLKKLEASRTGHGSLGD